MRYLAALLALSLAACAPAPVRPPQPSQAELEARARLAQEEEARRLAELEREAAERKLAELRRKQAEERKPYAGRITIMPDIPAQALDPVPAQPVAEPTPAPAPQLEKAPAAVAKAAPRPPVEPAKVEYATMAWQLSNDLRSLHSHPDVQTFYSERGWVVSLPSEALFEPGDDSIKAGEQKMLDRLARVLRHYAARGIVMDGPEVQRAQAIRRALSERGIPEQAITANGVGERVEFLVPLSHLSPGAGR